MKMKATTTTTSSKILAKKIWSIIRLMLTMVKKGISKGNLIMGINLFLKKSNQMAHKAINGLILHHNSLIFKPNNHFFSPSKLDYEFSCNNSPALGPYLIHMAHHHRPKPKSSSGSKYHFEDPATVTVVNRVLEMINSSEGSARSPLGMRTGMEMGTGTDYLLPGFGNGKSPIVRQLRVTDSPFPLKDVKGNVEELEEDIKVNTAVEEFIKKFYKNLKMQKSCESPYHMWAR